MSTFGSDAFQDNTSILPTRTVNRTATRSPSPPLSLSPRVSSASPPCPFKPLLYYHESFVKLVPKFGVVTSLRTNFAAEADELCSPGSNSRCASLSTDANHCSNLREEGIAGGSKSWAGRVLSLLRQTFNCARFVHAKITSREIYDTDYGNIN